MENKEKERAERLAKYKEEIIKLGRELQADISGAPVYVQDADGAFKTVVQLSVIDTTPAPKKKKGKIARAVRKVFKKQ